MVPPPRKGAGDSLQQRNPPSPLRGGCRAQARRVGNALSGKAESGFYLFGLAVAFGFDFAFATCFRQANCGL